MEIRKVFINKYILPGDVIGTKKMYEEEEEEEDGENEPMKRKTQTVFLGQGLHLEGGEIIATKAGILRTLLPQKNFYFIELHSQQKYEPQCGDQVIASIIRQYYGFYLLDLGGGCEGLLSQIGFDGATKRNKPELQKGDVVFCRVITVNKFYKPECTCITPKGGKKRDWVYQDGIFGQQKGGYMYKCNFGEYLRLQRDEEKVLNLIGSFFSFDLILGINGRVLVKSKDVKEAVCVVNMIRKSRDLTRRELKQHLESLRKKLENM